MSFPTRPMMQPDEVEYLTHALKGIESNAVVLEWGMGGSTYYLSQQLVRDQRLHSIEHDVQWFEQARKTIENLPRQDNTQVFLHHAPAEKVLSVVSNGTALEECPVGLANYINFAPLMRKDFDWSRVQLVLVDGVSRGSVLASLLMKLTPGTVVMMHDFTSDREHWYNWIVPAYDLEGIQGAMIKLRVPAR